MSIKKDRNMKARDRTNANWETAITKNLHKSSVKRAERDFVCSKIFILFTLQLKNIKVYLLCLCTFGTSRKATVLLPM